MWIHTAQNIRWDTDSLRSNCEVQEFGAGIEPTVATSSPIAHPIFKLLDFQASFLQTVFDVVTCSSVTSLYPTNSHLLYSNRFCVSRIEGCRVL